MKVVCEHRPGAEEACRTAMRRGEVIVVEPGPGDWLLIGGLAALWLGAQIVWVAPLPRQLRRGEVPRAARGSAEAFQLFWLDQYAYIGLVLLIGGAAAALAGWAPW